jgi:hypothetical protein
MLCISVIEDEKLYFIFESVMYGKPSHHFLPSHFLKLHSMYVNVKINNYLVTPYGFRNFVFHKRPLSFSVDDIVQNHKKKL